MNETAKNTMNKTAKTATWFTGITRCGLNTEIFHTRVLVAMRHGVPHILQSTVRVLAEQTI